ncbi:N-acetylglucosaminyldiphosphodolichol N-acetylglucosaminyltransferase catalytic subunit alg13 [Serendipita sp. 397]|nr:N-acetylglucosaminyldiphosphodolichol N-acetylglucosaminyltransferase catalytic subunit alg13 [Serendipita sp. 397]
MNTSGKTVFVTVGSTKFDALVDALVCEDVVETLRDCGFVRMIIQSGNSEVKTIHGASINEGVTTALVHGIQVVVWKFKKSLQDEYEKADLVIGHAGSGTIIEVLRLGKRMIAVPNETLLHNHQAELAEALESLNYLITCSTKDLAESVKAAMSRSFERFPEYDGAKFSSILDEEMGFS